MSKFWRYFLAVLFLFTTLVWLAAASFSDDSLHVVFCDVGQGDAILVYRTTTQILVDGGPDSSVLSCLSRHLPFWDRKIELVVMTHPQEDHMGGLVDVVRRYQIDTFVTTPVGNTTATFATLAKEIEDKQSLTSYKRSLTSYKQSLTSYKRIRVISLTTGTRLRVGLIALDTLWPEKAWLASRVNIESSSKNLVLGAATTKRDLNEFSIVQKLTFGEFDVLLTGDIGPPMIDQLAPSLVEGVEVLKVPHHGSKNGLTEALLEAAAPDLAVISVGKNNPYGHPHQEVIRLLADRDIRILRTDIDGEIEVVSDGKKWWIR